MRHIWMSSHALKAYLQLLLAIIPLVSHSKFLQMFPKSCGGCAIFQFYAIAVLHPRLDVEVHNLLKALLFDDTHKVRDMTKMIRRHFKRRKDPFPYIANCLDLAKEKQFVSSMNTCVLLHSRSIH